MMSSLHGLRILNTRAGQQAASLTYAIKQRGGISIEIPLIAIQSPENKCQRSKELEGIFESDWLVFTSQNSFNYTCEALEESGFYVAKVFKSKKIAVVGEKTKEVVEEDGFKVDVCPKQHFDAEHLAKLLIEASRDKDTFFYPKSNQSRKTLVENLINSGRQVHEMIAYETVINDQQLQLNDLIEKNKIDIVMLTSPSTVHSFFKQIREDLAPSIKDEVIFAAIGRVTAEALSRYDIHNVLVPEHYTIDSMLNLIEDKRSDF